MGASQIRYCVVVVALLGVAVASCGPRNLSALGNPGDLCTERTACTEGTACRMTELGYRCVGPDGRVPEPPAPSPPAAAPEPEPPAGDPEGSSAAEEDEGSGESERPARRPARRRGRRGRR